MADGKGEDKGDGEPRLVEDFHGFIKLSSDGFIKLYSDGSVIRSKEEPPLPLPPLQPPSHALISHKDIVYDADKGLWARVYLPPQSTPNQRFPVILYFHGGGFCYYTPATPAMHRLCLTWASDLSAVIVSVKYRLAPEHRLPAAYDDSVAALRWLHSQSTGEAETDPFLDSHANFSMVFVAGESAGGNIAHHVGMWAADPANESLPIRGMILVYPFFGGEERTASETRGEADQVLTVDMTDAMWRVALPVGSSRDHPYCNPLSAIPRSHEGGAGWKLPPMLFVIARRDILSDKQLEYCEVLKQSGEYEMEMEVYEEEDHGFTLLKMDHPNSQKSVQSISDFIKRKCCT